MVQNQRIITSPPLVSIIVPVYNLEDYLDDCINSVINQDYSNLEIILIDDGSTDKSPEIIAQWRKKDARIKSIQQINSGVSTARNQGIESSTGNYIMFIDGDDWIEKNCVSLCLNKAISEKVDIVKSAFHVVDPLKKISRRREIPNKTCTGDEAFKEFLCGRGWVSSVWAALYTSDLIKNNGLQFNQDEKIGEDGVFTMKALLNAKKICSINISLYNIRFRSGSASRNTITFSTEHRYVDIIDGSDENRQLRNVFKLRVLLSNLYRTAFQCRRIDFNLLYDKIKELDDFQALNNFRNIKHLPIRLKVVAIIAKNKNIMFLILKAFMKIGYKPLF